MKILNSLKARFTKQNKIYRKFNNFSVTMQNEVYRKFKKVSP